MTNKKGDEKFTFLIILILTLIVIIGVIAIVTYVINYLL